MAKFEDKYDELKIERLKDTLQRQAEAGRPVYFEIYVDGLKAVPKTNELSEFDNYQNFLMEDTERIRIIVYTASAISPRNDQFTYTMKKKENALAGAAAVQPIDIDAKIDEKLRQQREKWESDLVRQELQKTKQQLKEAEDYAEKLEAELMALREKKASVGNLNIGEIASVALEGFVRRNPQLIAKIPGAESLAGIIEADNRERQRVLSAPAPQPEAEVSFTRKAVPEEQNQVPAAENAVVLSEEEKNYIRFMRGIAESFDDEEIMLLTHIIQKFEEDASKLRTVADLLEIDRASGVQQEEEEHNH